MAYDPKARRRGDLMDDYYAKFYGPAAAPMKAYWTGDRRGDGEARQPLRRLLRAGGGVHAGVRAGACESRSKQAADGGEGATTCTPSGWRCTRPGSGTCSTTARSATRWRSGDFATAKAVYDEMMKRIDGLVAKGQANPRVRHGVPEAVPARRRSTAAWRRRPRRTRCVQVLPDQWQVPHRRHRRGRGEGASTRPDLDDCEVADGGDVLGDAQRAGAVGEHGPVVPDDVHGPGEGTAGWRSCSPRWTAR